jgi:hypothetical protein
MRVGHDETHEEMRRNRFLPEILSLRTNTPLGGEILLQRGDQPDRAAALVHTRFNNHVTGSLFTGGSRVGVTVEELLAEETP